MTNLRVFGVTIGSQVLLLLLHQKSRSIKIFMSQLLSQQAPGIPVPLKPSSVTKLQAPSNHSHYLASPCLTADSLYWKYSPNGSYTVKSGYQSLSSQHNVSIHPPSSTLTSYLWQRYLTDPLHIAAIWKSWHSAWYLCSNWLKSVTAIPTPPLGPHSWTKPPEKRVKLNVDASVGSGDDQIGIGWIVRDSAGSFCAAKNLHMSGSYSPKEAEAISTREALSWLKDYNWPNIIIGSDCLSNIEALQQPHIEDL
ncbi:unnamed protein product [Cuscuta campestris]|uniref:RNase H type-1 domain-containing protein n=1 Tax=Cuscuta campestris TaxID=132261 RepID=A0A484L943_9ASTE|nr:unnamed protein product [Cuscuta campestris]